MLVLCLFGQSVWAGHADVFTVEVTPQNKQLYTFTIKLRHLDSGWDHYANRIEIIAPDGKILHSLRIAEPHIQQQPFTHQVTDVHIPYNFTWVKIRAHDVQHGYGGRIVTSSIPR